MSKEKAGECVQVVVRCRPLSETEKRENCEHIVDVDTATNQVFIKDPNNGKEVSIYSDYFE
jgi:hypothetical protein